jgi:hypothetical protein
MCTDYKICFYVLILNIIFWKWCIILFFKTIKLVLYNFFLIGQILKKIDFYRLYWLCNKFKAKDLRCDIVINETL